MKTQKYIRKPFPVEAIQVTNDNMNDVAVWCKGNLEWTPAQSAPAGDNGRRRFIRVPVFSAKSEQQTMAFDGYWVLKAGNSFKVYGNATFRKDFQIATKDESDVLIVETKNGPIKVLNS